MSIYRGQIVSLRERQIIIFSKYALSKWHACSIPDGIHHSYNHYQDDARPPCRIRYRERYERTSRDAKSKEDDTMISDTFC